MPQHNSDPQKPSQLQLDENGSSEGLRKASPDVLRLFSETQRNLLELNRSRLSALDELRVANHKISDLEGKLEQVSNKTVATSPSTDSNSQQQESIPEEQAGTQNIITIAYETGWRRVMMHYSADGQAWTNLPGVEMQFGSEDLTGCKVLQVRGHSVEFVLNDGAGQWDTPDPYGSSQNKNYTVDSPGKYRLQGGRLKKLS